MGCSKSSSKREVYSNVTYLRKHEKSQINKPTLYLHQLEKEEQTKPRVSRRKEVMRSRAKSNEIGTEETIEKISETKSWFFEKINNIDKPLARLIKKKRERPHIKLEMKKEN